jgi:hypothetical protein
MKLTGQRCQCPTCGQGFNRVSTFDKHRVGEFAPGNTRRCLSTEEMQAKGWQVNAAGFWITASGGWRHA